MGVGRHSQRHRRRARGAGVDRAPLDSKMAYRHNTKFRAEPPWNPEIDFEKFGAPAQREQFLKVFYLGRQKVGVVNVLTVYY